MLFTLPLHLLSSALYSSIHHLYPSIMHIHLLYPIITFPCFFSTFTFSSSFLNIPLPSSTPFHRPSCIVLRSFSSLTSLSYLGQYSLLSYIYSLSPFLISLTFSPTSLFIIPHPSFLSIFSLLHRLYLPPGNSQHCVANQTITSFKKLTFAL